VESTPYRRIFCASRGHR